MVQIIRVLMIAAVCAGLTGGAMAGEKSKKGDGIKGMAQADLIKLALSAAPDHIAKGAGVMLPGEDGKLTEVKKSENGFTCIPTVNHRPVPDPMCFDPAVGQWVESMMNKAEKPSNTVPGISYMARGGYHWEKDGKILMNEEPGAKLVKEPPHWMMMWPFTSAETHLPTKPNPSGAWIMFDGTPYAHLMIYQDPKKMKEK